MTVEEKSKRIKTLEENFYKQMKKTIDDVNSGVLIDYQVVYKQIKHNFESFDSQRRKLYDEKTKLK